MDVERPEIEPRRLSADVVVIGGGVAGLVAARECAKVGLSTVIVERHQGVGGCMRRVEVAELAVDGGATSFRAGVAGLAELLEELGLDDDAVRPADGRAWIGGGDAPVRMPADTLFGVPANPLAEDVREVIGGRGTVRAWSDRVRPILRIGPARNFGDLVRSRMGDAVLDRLVAPVIRGAYRTDPDRIDLDALVPGLNQTMTRTGSLSGGVAQYLHEGREPERASLRGGMSRLVDALVADLARLGARLFLEHPVASLERAVDAGGSPRWLVRADFEGAIEVPGQGEVEPEPATGPTASAPLEAPADPRLGPLEVEARYAIVAADARTAVPLLEHADEAWQALAAETFETDAVETVVLVCDAPALDAEPKGVVFAAHGSPVRASLLVDESVRWAWLGEQAGPGIHVLRLSYDVAAQPDLAELDDDALLELAFGDAEAMLGASIDRAKLLGWSRTAVGDSASELLLGVRERNERLRSMFELDPTLAVTGSWLAGTGLARVVPDAQAAAHRIRRDAFRVAPA
ncbi:protoporphyrinogen/coproporphyrinogen oxidase [Agromyces archimandritae]|uniref:FAD-dependent oxidoreductase n=1 Tax=Agromyces archimandritae TaxID=2781962 RepID=A0A975FJ43_9MICO|nr:FAD-dependent oxidoreductase [Agromyces archimandritae]QTX03435.1 FAD-dependent oxidoreductase [Agromyces archimandritae]